MPTRSMLLAFALQLTGSMLTTCSAVDLEHRPAGFSSPSKDSKIQVDTEWGRLREVIVGRSGNIFPNGKLINWFVEAGKILPGDDFKEVEVCAEPANVNNWGIISDNPDPSGKKMECGKHSLLQCCPYNKVHDEADKLVKILERYSVIVHRPEVMSATKLEQNYGKETMGRQGAMNQFARDIMQVIGGLVIELTPGAANRRGEILNYHKLLETRLEQAQQAGERVARISMPTRDFSIQNYGKVRPDKSSPYNKNDYSVIEGGDVMLVGDHILVGHSENKVMGSSLKGIHWLQQTLNFFNMGKTVIPIRLDEKILHLDIVMSLPRRGLALVGTKPFADGSLPFPDGLPEIFDDWDVVETSGLAGMYMACNCLPIKPDVLVMADNSLAPLEIQADIKRLQAEVTKRNITVHTIDYGNHGFNGGALRCSSHPLRRDPENEN